MITCSSTSRSHGTHGPRLTSWRHSAGQANISRRSGQFGLSAAAPIDYATGWDLQKTAHLDQLKPLILIQGIDCRDWCILQDNTNYVRRKILLLMRRAKARRLLKKVCQWWVPQASG